MKKIIVPVMAAFLLLTFIPTPSNAGTEAVATSIAVNKPVEPAEAKVLLTRLGEIKAMDKSKLNSSEKKQLRKEVRSINQGLKELNGGVYLSVGAVIIIVLLLIILL